MKTFLAFLLIASFSPAMANTAPRTTTTKPAPSSDQSAVGSKKATAQEYVDVARTGQSATKREYEIDGQRGCRDADGVWHHPGDKNYSVCTKDAKMMMMKRK